MSRGRRRRQFGKGGGGGRRGGLGVWNGRGVCVCGGGRAGQI